MEFVYCCESPGNGAQNDSSEQISAASEAQYEAQLPLEHIHNVGQSLPALASELLDAQHSQHVEVARREDTIRNLKVHIRSPRL